MSAAVPPERRRPARPDRRRFLGGAAAVAAAAVAAACGRREATRPDAAAPGAAEPVVPAVPDAPAGSGLDVDPFTLGVASGDPLADAVILWTRLAPDPLAGDGAGGMGDVDVEVRWEVATDPDFGAPVAAGLAVATGAHGHTLHVDATGLAAGTDHYYRFRVGPWTSDVGRTRTLPAGTPDRFDLAVVNCQMYEAGHYGAYRHLLDEDLDLVVHLGDYIYEYPPLGLVRDPLPDHGLVTLADYRVRYATYRRDPDLAAAHARFPFVCTWDDHEVANNYTGSVVPGRDAAYAEALIAAAYQAWWEHLPVRAGPPGHNGLRVHQAVTVGDLARLHVLDERQHADVPPCREELDSLIDFGDCPARTARDRTLLGDDQERWLTAGLAADDVRWNLLANPVALAGVRVEREDGAGYYLETWDGYPEARRRLLADIAAARNPVVFSGDLHTGLALDVHAEPGDPTSAVVAPEFLAPPISSHPMGIDLTATNPHVREQHLGHGYLRVGVTPAALTATFRRLDDATDPATAVSTASSWSVAAGDPVARRA